MDRIKKNLGWIILVLIMGSGACRLTSPTPASWYRTPTALAMNATRTVLALTSQALVVDEIILTPTEPVEAPRASATPSPTAAIDGPWLVYMTSGGTDIHAFDVDAGKIIEINLPEPIYASDIVSGLSPDRKTLVVRAGSPLNVDELGLYQIDLPSTEVKQLTPLLSLQIQRLIVNVIGQRAFETLEAVTRADGIAWSPDGRYLAFTAALDNFSSDLYLVDTLNNRIERLNGLYSQNASPFWSPDSHWLVSQELGYDSTRQDWRSEFISGIRVPGFDDQNTLYLPVTESQGEAFVGWLNNQNFISYAITSEGPYRLQQVNVDNFQTRIIFDGYFNQVAFDPVSRSIALLLSDSQAGSNGMVGGVYLLRPEDTSPVIKRAGDWDHLSWGTGGMFVASGSQGLFTFSSTGEEIFLPGESDARMSPDGNWLIAWGNDEGSIPGARLYQPSSGHALQTIHDEYINMVFWQPDSRGFFIQTGGILYRLAFPNLDLKKIDLELSESEVYEWIWME